MQKTKTFLCFFSSSNYTSKNPNKEDDDQKKRHLKKCRFVCFFLVLCYCPNKLLGQIKVKVGVIQNLESDFGKLGLSCIKMALRDFYTSNPTYKTRLILFTRDSKFDVVQAAASGT
ncbi:hypothetical protein CsatA_028445 [Cannabis sativa]